MAPKHEPTNPSRRRVLKGAGLAGVGTVFGGAALSQTTEETLAPRSYAFLQPEEASFVQAATARLIPGDDDSPGPVQADVTNFIDKALAGSWGAAADKYVAGPWSQGVPQQGYQLRFTPAELYRTAMRAIERDLAASGQSFDAMSAEDQDAYLTRLEKGEFDLDGIPSDTFFDLLLQNTIEGYFADPSYGGNKNMVVWKAIGFPGAFASWYDLADQHGIDLSLRQANPVGMSHGASGHGGMNPNEKKTSE
jgi:gluconate 2-dehydrogenase gamma chain